MKFALIIFFGYFIFRPDLLACEKNNLIHFRRQNALMKLMQVLNIGVPADLGKETPANFNTPSKYMLDLYNYYSVSGINRNSYNATIVRSFQEQQEFGNSTKMVFNISGLGKDEEIVASELHVHWKLNSRLRNKFFEVKLNTTPKNNKIVTTYCLNDYKRSVNECNEKFVVTKSVLDSIKESGKIGFELLIGNARENKKIRIIRNQDFQPILVLFTKINGPVHSDRKNDYKLKFHQAPRVERSTSPNQRTCRRHDLTVDFEEIGYSDWIISPRNFSAYYCFGSCKFPLRQSQNPSNHATIQSIVHEFRLAPNVPSPCCVPSSLVPITLLYYDSNGNVILRHYEDMVVDSCGCL